MSSAALRSLAVVARASMRAQPVVHGLRPFSAAPALFADGNTHFRHTSTPHPLGKKMIWDNPMAHQVWSQEEVDGVQITHSPPKDGIERIAYLGVRALRVGFDIGSGYAFGPINESKLLRRIIFLETVAGIPGMVAGTLRHLKSLRRMRRDMGWIHTLLEEAENERMHLLCFMEFKKPSLLFRGTVLAAQGIFWNTFFFSYLMSPRLCHRFVGYIEEEAVKTYTGAIQALDNGQLPNWEKTPATELAKRYWKLTDDATMRDVLLAVRADEANHRDVNHTLSRLNETDVNPFLHHESEHRGKSQEDSAAKDINSMASPAQK
eukprot:m.58490 g.58490  ORF g.58490 m.58490 type:complete len:320 (-) comp7149_c0_seq2:123-1082(-)